MATNIYQALAYAKDNVRRAKDHYETVRAIVEMRVETTGKNADDRKRELIVGLGQSDEHRQALRDLRDAEHDVDAAQAAIDQAEAERRDQEWKIRARLVEALSGQHDDAAFEQVSDRRLVSRVHAQREMSELYT
jgi:hypothetical protein